MQNHVETKTKFQDNTNNHQTISQGPVVKHLKPQGNGKEITHPPMLATNTSITVTGA